MLALYLSAYFDYGNQLSRSNSPYLDLPQPLSGSGI
jgi:hypothetical protein